MSWTALKEQFGQEYAATKDFRRRFLGAMKSATGAYKDARIETVKGGLRLLPSPPPVKRKMVVLPPAAPPSPQPATSLAASASGHLGRHELVSEKALEQVPAIAPGWDKYFLAAKYNDWVMGEKNGELPRHADAAFLGWVKKFTKGKRPTLKDGISAVGGGASRARRAARPCITADLGQQHACSLRLRDGASASVSLRIRCTAEDFSGVPGAGIRPLCPG